MGRRRSSIYDDAIPDLGPAREAALNPPGQWHIMISYSQQSDRAAMLSRELRSSLRETGLSVWFDVDMNDN